jgi:hypothetical protein
VKDSSLTCATTNAFIFKGMHVRGLVTEQSFVGSYIRGCYMSAIYRLLFQCVLIFVAKLIHEKHENWNTTNNKTRRKEQKDKNK